MSGFTFRLRRPLEFTVNVSALNPDNLRGKTGAQICATKLYFGRRKVEASSLFSISGKDASIVQFKDCTNRLTHIGDNMAEGQVQVHGDAGDFLGKNLRGGTIEVFGSAGNWVAAGMSGGKIEIHGNCGDYLAASNSGELHGMRDGIIIVYGDAGHRLGERMRRGTIVVFGQAGEYCASQMIAGTIIIFGKTARYIGYGMKRGTIILVRTPSRMLPTFRHCGLLKIEFLRLLFKQLAISCKPFEIFSKFGPEAIRYAGDTSWSGKGEILVLKNARIPR